MKALIPLLLASGIASAECSPEQEKFVDSIEAIQGNTLEKMKRLCQNDILYFGNHILLPKVGAVAPHGLVATCDKKKACTMVDENVEKSQEKFKAMYEKLLSKKSV